nr:MAG TPA: Repressor protein CI [Caudoviricetes sp.]
MSFGNNLKKIRLDNDLTQEELAKKINTSRSNIANYENDKNMPSVDILEKMSKALNCSVDFLLGKNDKQELNKFKYYMCPVYGRISAGQPNWAEECIEGRLPIDIELMNIVNPEECFFLRVNGESMNKEIQNGSYALIRKTDSVDDGDIAVVLVNGYDATLKVFNRQGDFILLEPMSTDSSFKTQVYGKDTEIKIIGKYIGKMEMK